MQGGFPRGVEKGDNRTQEAMVYQNIELVEKKMKFSRKKKKLKNVCGKCGDKIMEIFFPENFEARPRTGSSLSAPHVVLILLEKSVFNSLVRHDYQQARFS